MITIEILSICIYTDGKCIYSHPAILGLGEWDSYDHHEPPTKSSLL